MVADLEDSRRHEPGFDLGERDMLDGWLDYHRTTLLLKVEGLSDDEANTRPVPTSTLSLHGLVRHMADVERFWFKVVMAKKPDLPLIYWRKDQEDADFELADKADLESDLDIWQAEIAEARLTAAAMPLDFEGRKGDSVVTLRWTLAHMIEEYARHNGHADLIRELVDGAVGC